MSAIHELIRPAFVTLNLQAKDAASAARELAELLNKGGVISDLSTYLAAVNAREAHSTTAVGFGVAIPHGKSAGVVRAAVAFGRANHDLDWESLDGSPVRMVFLIAAPEGANDEHLRALSQLARMLMDDEVRQQLLDASTPERLIAALQ